MFGHKKLLSLVWVLTLMPFMASAQLDTCPLPIQGAESTLFGLVILDAKTGDLIAGVNENATFVPASITKALTVASVLSQLPASKRYVTTAVAEGQLKDSILTGNLIISCSGDPTIESKHFPAHKGFADSIADGVKRLGINTIRGQIKFEYSYPLEQLPPKGWMAEDLSQPYGTGHHAFNFADNVSGGRADRAPQQTFINRLTAQLRQRGIALLNEKKPVTDTRKTILTSYSPEFGQIARSLMFRSDNMMAEASLRLLAPERTRESACQREMSLWDARGIDPSLQFVEDGSGLSRRNRISPMFLAKVLRWMQNSHDGTLYVSMFPKAGREGTMRRTFVNTPLEGRAAFKTGSMRGVQCFAGYILDDKGAPVYVVVAMANAFRCDRSKLKQEIGNYIIDKIKQNINEPK